MAYQRNYGYQYETSPRKIEPEYNPNIKKNNPYFRKHLWKTSTLPSKKNSSCHPASHPPPCTIELLKIRPSLSANSELFLNVAV